MKREEVDYTFEQVCEWVDELDMALILEIRDIFEATQSFKNLVPSEEPMTKKKQKSSDKKD